MKIESNLIKTKIILILKNHFLNINNRNRNYITYYIIEKIKYNILKNKKNLIDCNKIKNEFI